MSDKLLSTLFNKASNFKTMDGISNIKHFYQEHGDFKNDFLVPYREFLLIK